MSERKHPTHVIYHHDPASLPAELHAQYEVRQAPRADAATMLIPETVAGDVGPHTLPTPLPPWIGPGRLVRDDAARGWRFEPAVRDE